MISSILQGALKRVNLSVSKLAKLNFFSMNFKEEPEESIYFTLGVLKPFHIKNLQMEPH